MRSVALSLLLFKMYLKISKKKKKEQKELYKKYQLREVKWVDHDYMFVVNVLVLTIPTGYTNISDYSCFL